MRLLKVILFSLVAFVMLSANEEEKVKLERLNIVSDVNTSQTLPLLKALHENRYEIVKIRLDVIGYYSDGHTERVTDWAHIEKDKEIKYFGANLFGVAVEGTYTMQAELDGIKSNIFTFSVKKSESLLRTYVHNNKKWGDYLGRSAELEVQLAQKPKSDVRLNLHINDDTMLFSQSNSQDLQLIFKAEEYNKQIWPKYSMLIKDLKPGKIDDFSVVTDAFFSDDPNFSQIDPQDILIHKDVTPKIYPPRASQTRGAIAGSIIRFPIYTREYGLDFSLVNAPEGMKIIGKSDYGQWNEYDGIDILWDIPLDIEKKRYDITVKGKDIEGKEGEVTFNITVPETALIQTEVKNNELIVTDKKSLLYGMKMKGHDGEDIISMRLESVSHKSLSKKHIKLDTNDIPMYVPFIIYNMPEKLDVKFPEYLDSAEKAVRLNAHFVRYPEEAFISGGGPVWKGAFNYYNYENTNGSIILNEANQTNTFLIIIGKSL